MSRRKAAYWLDRQNLGRCPSDHVWNDRMAFYGNNGVDTNILSIPRESVRRTWTIR